MFASIGSAFRFADLATRIAEVGSENEVFVRTIQVVRDDLHEVERLLSVDSVQRKVTIIPGKLPWIRGAIINTKSSLDDIGKWVERAHSEQEATGAVQFDTRVKWVFKDHEKLLNRTTQLTTCHQQLLGVLGYLVRLEDIPTTSKALYDIDTAFFDDVLARHNRKAGRQSSLGSVNGIETTLPPVIKPEHRSVLHGNESRPSSSFVHGEYSQNPDYSIIPTNPTIWSASPPGSPPPTYTSVVSASRRGGQLGGTPVVTHKNSSYDVYENPTPADSASIESRWHEKQQDVRAHEYSQLVPELAGDTVHMSGTNTLGPVNPYSYTPIHSSKQAFTTKPTSTNEAGELHGDSSFDRGPSICDPGPPPGYPPRQAQKPTSYSPREWSSNVMLSHQHRMSLPELPAFTRRKPVATHANTDFGPMLQSEMFSASTTSSSTITSESRAKSNVFELASREPYTAPRDYHTNVNLPNNNTNSFAATPTPPPNHRQQHHGYQNSQISANPIHTKSHNPPLQSADASSLARMQRQKNMLHLLGSLD
ncbi:hypothetical protein CC86DRAFT_413835 [Ophiobolus disseminans]|uniref:Fungal N-terminal domain-containing protein n=1 Tax=Ophiobolus disseminans TaxID=1469910 RepID=A0A6A6ZCR9_9PLEO|nr:hypothetical protein CC86DRAFT_413835 [Ophiobolus disseminans]